VHAVVSLLDQSHYEKVEALWSELASRFGLRGIYRTPYPHFSYHVAAGYDVDRLSDARPWPSTTWTQPRRAAR